MLHQKKRRVGCSSTPRRDFVLGTNILMAALRFIAEGCSRAGCEGLEVSLGAALKRFTVRSLSAGWKKYQWLAIARVPVARLAPPNLH
jgi:hypothetical protein